MSVFLSGFITLNSGVFYTLLSSVIYLPSTLLSSHIDIQPPPPRSAVRSRPPWLNGVIFSQRRPLIGSQWRSKDFDGEIETNRLNFAAVVVRRRPALTDSLAANLILSIQGLNRQMDALRNSFSRSHTWMYWRSNPFECLHRGLFHTFWDVCLPSTPSLTP